MEITFENLNAFVRKYGPVTYEDTQGRTTKLPSGDADSFDLAAKADRFLFDGKLYSRSEFERLMDERM